MNRGIRNVRQKNKGEAERASCEDKVSSRELRHRARAQTKGADPLNPGSIESQQETPGSLTSEIDQIEVEATVVVQEQTKRDDMNNPTLDAENSDTSQNSQQDPMEISTDAMQEPRVAGESEEANSTIVDVELPDPFDIDSKDAGNQFAVTEYLSDIHRMLRVNEERCIIDQNYMSRQPDINARMRVILNDWLIEVHLKFKLRQETLYLCFQLIDRFLSSNTVPRQSLQLVGMTGLMLASKYEEIYPPEIRDYIYICDNAYTRDQILKMEQTMLNKLNYTLSLPTCWSWMKRFAKVAHKENDLEFFHLLSYMIELSYFQMKMLAYRPSMLVAASVCFAKKMLKEDPEWSEMLQHHTGYEVQNMIPCMNDLRGLILQAKNETQYKAVYKKFSHSKYSQVCCVPTSWNLLTNKSAGHEILYRSHPRDVVVGDLSPSLVAVYL
uniref:Cyclin N-terminal domain-containing protein n=1 Tax=Hanusia phi TaxID=3032 RepID=A0A7S0HEJ3_9CRYP